MSELPAFKGIKNKRGLDGPIAADDGNVHEVSANIMEEMCSRNESISLLLGGVGEQEGKEWK